MKKVVPLFKPLNKTKLHEEIVEQLKNRLINRDIAPGEKLPAERTLAQMFNVNRSTVREALGKLESMNLVEIRHGEGVYVKDYLDSGSLELVKALLFKNGALDMNIFRNMLDLRELLVPEMAYCAAKNRTDKDINALEALAFESGEDTIGERDMRIHHAIAKASGNVLYVILLNAFTGHMNDYYALYFREPENRRLAETFHRNIFVAIKNKDPESAKLIMKDVLQTARKNVLQMLA